MVSIPECEDKSTNTTALQMAVIRGNLLTTQLLIEHGANPRTLSKVRFRKRYFISFWTIG